ncbi:MAG: hypothetical protein AAF194_07300, partial [Pseudomonadota bacterium]
MTNSKVDPIQFLREWTTGWQEDHCLQLVALDRNDASGPQVLALHVWQIRSSDKDLHDRVWQWLHDQNWVRERNVYFSPNPLDVSIFERGTKWDETQVLEQRYLTGDVDCRDLGKKYYNDFEACRDKLKADGATVVIQTGNGYHPAWKLEAPVKLLGFEDRKKAKHRNVLQAMRPYS